MSHLDVGIAPDACIMYREDGDMKCDTSLSKARHPSLALSPPHLHYILQPLSSVGRVSPRPLYHTIGSALTQLWVK